MITALAVGVPRTVGLSVFRGLTLKFLLCMEFAAFCRNSNLHLAENLRSHDHKKTFHFRFRPYFIHCLRRIFGLDALTPIPQTNWILHFVDSEELSDPST